MLHRHYLGKWPGVSTAIFALCRDDVPVGCCVFAEPPRETSKRYGCKTWELARLWVDDAEPRNTETWFLARVVKLLRRLCPSVACLVSYADPSVGHVGTVYKAANWQADGFTDEERRTPRFDYSVNGRVYSRRAHVPAGAVAERVPRVRKARYVYRLRGRGSEPSAAMRARMPL